MKEVELVILKKYKSLFVGVYILLVLLYRIIFLKKYNNNRGKRNNKILIWEQKVKKKEMLMVSHNKFPRHIVLDQLICLVISLMG
jgi:hypothetical protein